MSDSMQIAIEHSALLRALTNVQGVVERRTTIPILSHVLLEAESELCRLTATDLDIRTRVEAPAIVAGPGKAAVHALTLFDIVRHLPEGAQVDMTLEGGGKTLALKAGRARFALPTLPPEDFPSLAAGAFPHQFALPPADLRRLLEKTRFAISADESRYYLNGIYFHSPKSSGGPLLRAVATDGHRLACADCALPKDAAGAPGVIVPRKTIGELRRFLEAGPEDIRISVSKTMIRYQCGGATITSKVIDGSFPDYDRVIPKKNDKTLTLPAADLARALQLVAAVVHDGGVPAVKLDLQAGKLVLSVSNEDQATAHEELDTDYDAARITIGFNANYLSEITAQISGAARLEMDDPGAPTIIRDSEDNSVLYVLMPMRV